MTQDVKIINPKFPLFYCFTLDLKDQVSVLVKIPRKSWLQVSYFQYVTAEFDSLTKQPCFVKGDFYIYFFDSCIRKRLQFAAAEETRNILRLLFFMKTGYFSFIYLLKRALPVKGPQRLNTCILG